MPEVELAVEIPARALAVYAHPDDPDVSCGGTLALWAAGGCEVHVVIAATGDKGTTDPTVAGADLAARRAEEVKAAGAVVGVAAHHLLGYPDGEVDDGPELRSRLVALVRSIRPDVVLCPDPTAVLFGRDYFNHLDHRVVGWAALDAVAPAAAMPHYFPQAGPPHQVDRVYLSGTLQPDVWVDVSATIEAKLQAVLCHASQLGDTTEWLRDAVPRRAREAGRAAGVAHAEAFRLLRLTT